MKFRVTKKDLTIFCIFCVLLLYLCAVAVLNFDSFANEGVFYGLLPFKAFTFKYLPITLGMFVISLIAIFTSVSSYIFDKEKGKPGIKIGEKEEKGYSRWAKEKEIMEDKGVVAVDPSQENIPAAGIPLLYKKNLAYVDNSQYHNLVIGTTGSGKSESVVKPMVKLLAKNSQSMLITDPKGELYENTAEELKKRGYNVIVLNFRDPEKGNSWNPLTLPYKFYKEGNLDKATELIDDIAQNIIIDAKSNADPFWERSAADYFSGLVLALFKDGKEEEVNLNSINLMATVGEERFGASRYINEYFKLKGETSSEYIFAANTINAPQDTKGSILSTFRQKVRTFTSRDKLSNMLSYSDFDMRKIGTEKTAVFMIIHDEKTTYHTLLTIFIKQAYESLVDVASHQPNLKLPYKTNFILDEFANMPALKDVGAMVSAARSRDIRMTFIIQNFAQLSGVYGKDIGDVIKGNCNNWIYLLSTEIACLEEISKICGEVKSKEKEKTASTPLISVSDLQKFKMGEALLIRSRKHPFKTKLTADFDIDWGMDKTVAVMPDREKREIELFDLKAFVSEEIRKKEMENPGNSNPFASGMPGFGPSPFGGGNPFANNPFASSMPAKANPLSDIDIDKVMADIDKRLKELDEEEEREKQKQSLVSETTTDEKEEATFIEDIKDDNKEEENNIEEEKTTNNKPKINVDFDSVVVNDNVITDDEFFDDFFQE